jgi:hypothetical protein
MRVSRETTRRFISMVNGSSLRADRPSLSSTPPPNRLGDYLATYTERPRRL